MQRNDEHPIDCLLVIVGHYVDNKNRIANTEGYSDRHFAEGKLQKQ